MKRSNPVEWKVGTSYTPGGTFTLSEIKEAGLDSIELVISRNEADLSYEGLKGRFNPYIQEAHKLGLEVWSVHLPFGKDWDISSIDLEKREQILEYHYEWLRWVSEWNINQVVIHPSYEPIPDNERIERIKACKSSLHLLAEKAKPIDIHICVEDLPRTCLGNTSDEMKTLIDVNKDLRVCSDVNHLLLETPEHFIQELGGKIATVHISDYDGVDERHWLPGKGIIQWNRVISALAQSGYEGTFMFEVKMDKCSPSQLIDCWGDLLTKYKEAAK